MNPVQHQTPRIWLAPAQATIPESALPSVEFRMVYLGRDSSELRRWRRMLPPKAKWQPLPSELDRAAHELRGPYLELIKRLGAGNSLAWELSGLAESNTTLSPLFLDCCHLKVVLEETNQPGGLLVVAESRALLDILAQNAGERGAAWQWLGGEPPPGGQSWAAGMASGGKRFLAWGRSRRAAARGTRHLGRRLRPNPGRPRVLLHTFVDEAALGKDGEFHERYWGELPAWLRGQGYQVVYLPFFLHLRRSHHEAMAWLRQSRERFLIPEDYYRAGDYLGVLAMLARQARLPRGRVTLAGMDITALVAEERRRHTTSTRSAICAMYLFLARRLAGAGLRVDHLMYTSENHTWERALAAGFARHLPQVKITAFQHTVLPPFYLGLFLPPPAGRTVCNGDFFKDQLLAEGWPSGRVVTGCALRYQHLHHLPQTAAPAGRTVLLALPIDRENARELVELAAGALPALEDAKVLLKPHPMMPPEQVREIRQSLPPEVEMVQGSLQRWLAQSAVMVTTGSAVSLEALAMGVPVVRVRRSIDLDLDPLTVFPGQGEPCRSAREIAAMVNRYLQLDSSQREELVRQGRQLAARCFAPITPEGLGSFLQGLAGEES